MLIQIQMNESQGLDLSLSAFTHLANRHSQVFASVSVSESPSENNHQGLLTEHNNLSPPAMNATAHFQQHLFAPPILVRRDPIALPALSPNIPIQTNPVITYCHSIFPGDTSLQWDISLPATVARLVPSQHGDGSSWWTHEPALEPQSISSMVIRIPKIERPVVVFPETVGDPITISDILRTVSVAIRAAVGTATVAEEGASGSAQVRGNNLAAENANTATAVRRHFGRKVFWGGLYDSPSERDVWILQLYGPRRGGRRTLFRG